MSMFDAITERRLATEEIRLHLAAQSGTGNYRPLVTQAEPCLARSHAEVLHKAGCVGARVEWDVGVVGCSRVVKRIPEQRAVDGYGELGLRCYGAFRRRGLLPLGRLYHGCNGLVLHGGPRVGHRLCLGPALDPGNFGTVDQAFLLQDGGKQTHALLRIQLLHPAEIALADQAFFFEKTRQFPTRRFGPG